MPRVDELGVLAGVPRVDELGLAPEVSRVESLAPRVDELGDGLERLDRIVRAMMSGNVLQLAGPRVDEPYTLGRILGFMIAIRFS